MMGEETFYVTLVASRVMCSGLLWEQAERKLDGPLRVLKIFDISENERVVITLKIIVEHDLTDCLIRCQARKFR